MAEDKGLLASAIETVKAISLNGNGVHGDSGSTASGTPNSEDTNGRESKVEEAETKSKAPAESSEGPQSHRVVAKFLMSNAAAGSIIGKQGANITDLQNKSAARLQLSRSSEFFPGTRDRVLICSGNVDQVVAALRLIITAVDTELVHNHDEDIVGGAGPRLDLRFLLPSALCGVLIGKSGSTIRQFGQDSGARITVSPQQEQLPGVSDRVVLLLGTKDQVLQAMKLILNLLKDSRQYQRLSTTPVFYGGPAASQMMPWGQFPPNPHFQPPMLHMAPQGSPHQYQMLSSGEQEVRISVPEGKIGAVIGKGGEIITSLKTLVGVRIRISERDMFIPGTRDREVTVTGTPEAVHLAKQLILQKVHQSGGPPVRQ